MDTTESLSPLTPRESEILTLVREGRSSKEIARDLGITRSTVRCHVQRVLTKLGVATRLQAAALAPPTSAAALPRPRPLPPPSAPISALTPRETQVLRCIAIGIGRAEIAKHLFMSPHTARTHIQRILAKLEVHSAIAAMAAARRAGIPAQKGA
jgi:DNA-binding NarL/FixJ family response regulator